MPPLRRRESVPVRHWTRLRDHLPDDLVRKANAAAMPARVDAYHSARAANAAAIEAVLGALFAEMLAEFGAPGDGPLGRLVAALDDARDCEGEAETGMPPGDRAAVRRLAASAAGELGATLRRLAVRAETIELGLTLRAEDLEAEQRIADVLNAARRRRTDPEQPAPAPDEGSTT